MKKVVYLAPIFLLSFLGKNAMAGQVEHVSNLDSALEQASAINNSTADTNRNTTVLQNQVLNINKTNQTAIPDSIKQSTGFQDEKIAANTNVTINNPANNRIHVNWVNSKGEAIHDVNGYDIDLTKAQPTDKYRWLPDGYSLKHKNQYKVNHSSHSITTEYYSTDYPDAEFGYTQYGERKIYWSQKDGYTHNFTDEDGDFCISEDGNTWSGDKNKFSDDDLNNMWKGANIPSFNSINTGVSYEKQVDEIPETNTTNTYTFTDNSGNVFSTSGNTVNVILQHQTQTVDVNSTQLGNNATNNVFEINGDNKKQVSAQIRNFKSPGLLDLITNAIQIPGNWQATTNPNFDKVTLTNPIGYDALNSKLLVLSL